MLADLERILPKDLQWFLPGPGMHIETAKRYHFTHARMARIKIDNNSVGEVVEMLKSPYIAGGNVNRYSYFGKTVGVPQVVKHRVAI